jgi:hypothetical protein
MAPPRNYKMQLFSVLAESLLMGAYISQTDFNAHSWFDLVRRVRIACNPHYLDPCVRFF